MEPHLALLAVLALGAPIAAAAAEQADGWATAEPRASVALVPSMLDLTPRSRFFVVVRGTSLTELALGPKPDVGTLELFGAYAPNRWLSVGAGLDLGFVSPNALVTRTRYFVSNLKLAVGFGGPVWTQPGSQSGGAVRLLLAAGLDGYAPVASGVEAPCDLCLPYDAVGLARATRPFEPGLYLLDVASGRARVGVGLEAGPLTVAVDLGLTAGGTTRGESRGVALFQVQGRVSALVGLVEPRLEVGGLVGLTKPVPNQLEQVVLTPGLGVRLPGGFRPAVVVPIRLSGDAEYRFVVALELTDVVEHERRPTAF